MIKANKEELKFINKRYNDVKEDINIGTDYVGEGTEIVEFEVDDNGRTTMIVEETWLNRQYAMRNRYHTRHPRLKQNEINYLLGRRDDPDEEKTNSRS